MRARAVIGANFGDEGKGTVVDYLSAQGAGMVVRYNGGAQAGHTVVTPDGRRHVFSHIGAGAFCGVPTFLSQFFVCNPILFFEELARLNAIGVNPIVYGHPNCLVTTFADMFINQEKERERGDKRHGSCGVGFSETITRSELPELKITMSDLWNGVKLDDKLEEICGKYSLFRTGKKIKNPYAMIEEFIKRCEAFAGYVHPLGIAQCKDPIFEGAQGLLLDQNNKEFFPHLTRSNTGMKNIRFLCDQAGIKDIDTYYVTRTYLTRHGAGPLPQEDPKLSYYDDTNLEHDFQGKIRFAPFTPDAQDALGKRCQADCGYPNFFIVKTHLDQASMRIHGHLNFDGPTREHGSYPSEKKALAS